MKINTKVQLKFWLGFLGRFVIFEGAVNLTLTNDANIVLKKVCVFSLKNDKKKAPSSWISSGHTTARNVLIFRSDYIA